MSDQSNPGWKGGEIPSAADWDALWSGKEDAGNALPKSGGQMTGSLLLAHGPTQPNEAATKAYVDGIGGGGGGLTPIPSGTVLGNVSGASAIPTALNTTSLTPLVGVFSGGTSGAVPASGGGTTDFLRADGQWVAPPTGGSGSPGGTNGQLQFNNAGAFGGLTVGSGLSVSGGALNATAPGAGGSNGQLQVNSSGSLAGLNIGAGLSNVSGSLIAQWIAGQVSAIGSGLSLSAGTLTATGGGGTITGLTSVANIGALRAGTSGSLGSGPIFVQGYYAAADGGGGIFVLGSSATDDGGCTINDASSRSWHRQIEGSPISIKFFGARVDGVTDDTAACAAADAWSRAHGFWPVLFPEGICMVSQLVLYTGSNWMGVGRSTPEVGSVNSLGSEIRQIIGANTDLLYCYRTAENWGATATSMGTWCDSFQIRNLTINGNWNYGTGNTVGNGLYGWFAKAILDNFYVCNVAGCGMLTGWIATDSHDQTGGTQPPGYNLWSMGINASHIQIDNVGQHGWWNWGPHDNHIASLEIISASGSASNTYDMYRAENNSSSFIQRYSCYTRHGDAGLSRTIAQCGINLNSSSGHYFAQAYPAGSNFPVRIATSHNRFLDVELGGSHSGAGLYLEGGATQNYIHGKVLGEASNYPSTSMYALVFGSSGTVEFNDIDLMAYGCDGGAVYFGAANAGHNRIRIKTYTGTAATYSGTPQVNDDMVLDIWNSNGQWFINNNYQKVGVPLSSGVALFSGSNQYIATLPLTPGTWDISAEFAIANVGGASSVVHVTGGIDVVGAGIGGPTYDGQQTQAVLSGATISGAYTWQMMCARSVVELSTYQNVYLIGMAEFGGGGLVGFGNITATRL